MDPDENLTEQLKLAQSILDADKGGADFEIDAQRLAELVLALHEWISKNGHLPQAWFFANK